MLKFIGTRADAPPNQAALMSYMRAAVERVERLGLPIPKGLHKFLAVGLVGLVVHTSVFTLLYKLNDHPLVSKFTRFLGDTPAARALNKLTIQHSWAWLTGLIIATSITWTLNRKLTFAATGRKLHHEVLRYAVVTLVSQSVSYFVFHALVERMKQIPPPVDVVIGAAVATLFSYFGSRFFTFAPQSAQKGDK